MTTIRPRLLVAVLALLLAGHATSAQTRFTYSRGQSVSPAYEGWWQNADGTYTLFFGYMNSNWEEQLDVPVGPDNNIEPGGPDQGQPTWFLPRRNRFLHPPIHVAICPSRRIIEESPTPRWGFPAVCSS